MDLIRSGKSKKHCDPLASGCARLDYLQICLEPGWKEKTGNVFEVLSISMTVAVI